MRSIRAVAQPRPFLCSVQAIRLQDDALGIDVLAREDAGQR